MALDEERMTWLRQAIADELCEDFDVVLPESRLVDLGADSLDMVAIVSDIEEQFSITVDEELELKADRTVQWWHDYIGRQK